MLISNHYKNITQFDIILKYPKLVHASDVPKLRKLTIVWISHNTTLNIHSIIAINSARLIITGQIPKIIYTTKAVSERHLQSGDPIGCMVSVSSNEVYSLIDILRTTWVPVTKGNGFNSKVELNGQGQLTCHLKQLNILPIMLPYYQEYHYLLSGGKNHTQQGSRHLLLDTTATTYNKAYDLLTNLRVPLNM